MEAKSLERHILDYKAEQFQMEMSAALHPNDYWRTRDGSLIHITQLRFGHLENIINHFSKDGVEVPDHFKETFERVMLMYLRKQAEINEVHKDIL